MRTLTKDVLSAWPQRRLRFVLDKQLSPERIALLSSAQEVNFVPMEAVGENGELLLDQVKEKEAVENGYTLFFDGDVVVAKITPCFENRKGASVKGLHNGVAYGTTELHVLTPSAQKLTQDFLFYVTVSDAFRVQGEAAMKGAAGQKRVPDDFIQDFRIGVPPVAIQSLVSSYLDRETARIDKLVGDKEEMLRLLNEKRSASIKNAITGGIKRTARKHSGQDWIGEVPAHWQIKRSKHLLIERDDRSVTGEEEMLTVSHLTGITPRSEKDVNMFEAETNERYKIVSPDNLVINTLWAWMGAMGVSKHEGIVSPAYHVYRISQELLPAYVDALVRTPAFVAEITRFSKGVWSSRLRLYPEGLHEVWIPVPSLDEQRAIVAHLEAERESTSEIEATLQNSITLLQERRKALITAAVTGQIPIEAMS